MVADLRAHGLEVHAYLDAAETAGKAVELSEELRQRHGNQYGSSAILETLGDAVTCAGREMTYLQAGLHHRG